MKDNRRPRICATLALPRMEMVKAGASAALSQGADLVEIRLDYLINPSEPLQKSADIGLPVIATMRREIDGGRFRGSEEARWDILREAAGVSDYTDLEFGFAKSDKVGELHDAGTKV
ncbi:MAG: type I 3-dehydroquinate dehydratase, partial [Theionarchaea archaeon]|nr:type I 3-dehydroquinate dehydratase [Theionarchaea archaeon]